MWAGTVGCYEVTFIPVSDMLGQICISWSRSDASQAGLSVTMESFLSHFSLKASQWCEAGIYLLASQAVDKCQSQEGAETALVEIEKFLVTAKEHQLSNPKEFYNQFDMILTPEIKVKPLRCACTHLEFQNYQLPCTWSVLGYIFEFAQIYLFAYTRKRHHQKEAHQR